MRFVDASLFSPLENFPSDWRKWGASNMTSWKEPQLLWRAGVEQREQPKSAWSTSTKPFNYEQIIFTEKLPARASFRTTEFFPFKAKSSRRAIKSINPFLYLPDYSFHLSQPAISRKPAPLLNRIPGPGPSLTRGTERMLGLVPAGSRGCTVGVP